MPQSIKDILNDCVHCGLCLPSCPTYNVSGLEAESPRGRLMLMDYISTKNKTNERVDESVFNHLSSCLDCRGCETVCPSGVNYHIALEHTWEQISFNKKKSSFLSKSILLSIKNPFLLKIFFKLVNMSKSLFLDKLLELFSKNLSQNIRSMPAKNSKLKPGIYSGIKPIRGTVGLFPGCLMSEIYPNVHHASLNVIRNLGFNVFIPEGNLCCGALHRHEGEIKSAQNLLDTSMVSFSKVDTVVVNSAGCGAELKNRLEGMNPEIMDFTEFVFKNNVPLKNKLNINAAWDNPCHLIHGQKISNEPKQLLENIGVNLVDFGQGDMCCGAAGNYVNNHPEYSQKILDMKMDEIEKLNINTVITANPGCQLQLQKGVIQRKLPLKVTHIAEILEMAISKNV